MVGPKKHDFWLKTNILKGSHCILRIQGAPVCQKLRMILENKVVQKLKLEKNVFDQKWSPKLPLKVQFWHFLLNHNSSQDCFKTISFEHVDFWAKILDFRTQHL